MAELDVQASPTQAHHSTRTLPWTKAQDIRNEKLGAPVELRFKNGSRSHQRG